MQVCVSDRFSVGVSACDSVRVCVCSCVSGSECENVYMIWVIVCECV